ncbi:MAG: hypothetical protein NC924_07645, partial [Candidatus Omnitrophica bacterium]|nr:hypothetical protein [Candidatus Omnitrophota bacterium]
MDINAMIKQTSGWLKGTGPHAEIVFSSRVRLARNIEKLIFPNWAQAEPQEQAVSVVVSPAERGNLSRYINLSGQLTARRPDP